MTSTARQASSISVASAPCSSCWQRASIPSSTSSPTSTRSSWRHAATPRTSLAHAACAQVLPALRWPTRRRRGSRSRASRRVCRAILCTRSWASGQLRAAAAAGKLLLLSDTRCYCLVSLLHTRHMVHGGRAPGCAGAALQCGHRVHRRIAIQGEVGTLFSFFIYLLSICHILIYSFLFGAKATVLEHG